MKTKKPLSRLRNRNHRSWTSRIKCRVCCMYYHCMYSSLEHTPCALGNGICMTSAFHANRLHDQVQSPVHTRPCFCLSRVTDHWQESLVAYGYNMSIMGFHTLVTYPVGCICGMYDCCVCESVDLIRRFRTPAHNQHSWSKLMATSK